MSRSYWLANALSLVRLPLAALLWLAPADQRFVLPLLLFAGLTDMLDGYVARHSGRELPQSARDAQARLGAWLDPACDKVFIASAAVALFHVHAPAWHLIVLLLLRDLLLAPLTLVWLARPGGWRASHPLTAAWPGKIDTGLQALALLSLLLYTPAFATLCWLAGVGGAVAVAHYLWRAARPGPPQAGAAS